MLLLVITCMVFNTDICTYRVTWGSQCRVGHYQSCTVQSCCKTLHGNTCTKSVRSMHTLSHSLHAPSPIPRQTHHNTNHNTKHFRFSALIMPQGAQYLFTARSTRPLQHGLAKILVLGAASHGQVGEHKHACNLLHSSRVHSGCSSCELAGVSSLGSAQQRRSPCCCLGSFGPASCCSCLCCLCMAVGAVDGAVGAFIHRLLLPGQIGHPARTSTTLRASSR